MYKQGQSTWSGGKEVGVSRGEIGCGKLRSSVGDVLHLTKLILCSIVLTYSW